MYKQASASNLTYVNLTLQVFFNTYGFVYVLHSAKVLLNQDEHGFKGTRG